MRTTRARREDQGTAILVSDYQLLSVAVSLVSMMLVSTSHKLSTCRLVDGRPVTLY